MKDSGAFCSMCRKESCCRYTGSVGNGLRTDLSEAFLVVADYCTHKWPCTHMAEDGCHAQLRAGCHPHHHPPSALHRLRRGIQCDELRQGGTHLGRINRALTNFQRRASSSGRARRFPYLRNPAPFTYPKKSKSEQLIPRGCIFITKGKAAHDCHIFRTDFMGGSNA